MALDMWHDSENPRNSIVANNSGSNWLQKKMWGELYLVLECKETDDRYLQYDSLLTSQSEVSPVEVARKRVYLDSELVPEKVNQGNPTFLGNLNYSYEDGNLNLHHFFPFWTKNTTLYPHLRWSGIASYFELQILLDLHLKYWDTMIVTQINSPLRKHRLTEQDRPLSQEMVSQAIRKLILYIMRCNLESIQKNISKILEVDAKEL